MITITRKFSGWLLSQTRMTRYFVVAVMFHVALLVVFGSIKIVTKLPATIRSFIPIVEQPNSVTTSEGAYTKLTTLEELKVPPAVSPGGDRIAGNGAPGPDRLPTFSHDPVVGRAGPAVGSQPGPSGIDALTDLQRFKAAGGLPSGNSAIPHDLTPRLVPNKVVVFQPLGYDRPTETAVVASLRWLKSKQQRDGSWTLGASAPAGTALALLAFSGHGETPDSRDFGNTITKGFLYLINQVKPNGDIAGNMYVEGLVGLALAETYGLTGAPPLREPLERVAGFIVAAQKARKQNPIHAGGWRYSPLSTDADLSVTGWQIMALRSARDAGIAIPDEVFHRAAEYVWNMYGAPGFGYATPAATPTMTAVGVLCQQFLGCGTDKRVRPALDFLARQKMDWDKAKGGFVLYGWYYMTQALFQGGRSHWPAWSDDLKRSLLHAQYEDGHWDAPAGSNEANIGPVYSTTLCALMLEVYYRHLPMYQLVDPTVLKDTSPRAPLPVYRSSL